MEKKLNLAFAVIACALFCAQEVNAQSYFVGTPRQAYKLARQSNKYQYKLSRGTPLLDFGRDIFTELTDNDSNGIGLNDLLRLLDNDTLNEILDEASSAQMSTDAVVVKDERLQSDISVTKELMSKLGIVDTYKPTEPENPTANAEVNENVEELIPVE